jgi:hypothetical protein
MPTFVFLHPLDDNHRRLRGGDWFDTIRDGGFPVVTSSDDEPGINPAGRNLIFACVHADAPYVEALVGIAARPYSCLLVDVCGPIWAPDQVLGQQAARDYWADPGNYERALQLLRAADGVTTPHPAYAEWLLDVNPNVFVLPDVADSGADDQHEEALLRFSRDLQLAWHTAFHAKTGSMTPG